MFTYRARDPSGGIRTGRIEAESLAEARQLLGQRDMEILDVRRYQPAKALGELPTRSKGAAEVPTERLPAGVPTTKLPTAEAPDVREKAAPARQAGLWERLDLRKVCVFLLAIALTAGILAYLARVRPRPVEVTLSGRLRLKHAEHRAASGIHPFGNVKLYAYFPGDRILVSEKGTARLEGTRWKPFKDSLHAFEQTVRPDGSFEVRLSYTGRGSPRSCTVTAKKPGYRVRKKRDLAVTPAASGLAVSVPEVWFWRTPGAQASGVRR